MKIDFHARGQSNQIVSLRRAARELAIRMSDEHRSVAPFAQSENGEQHLALAAPPRSCRVEL
jgi:hypothetical protein